MDRKPFSESMCTRMMVSERPPVPVLARESEPNRTMFMPVGFWNASVVTVTVLVVAAAVEVVLVVMLGGLILALAVQRVEMVLEADLRLVVHQVVQLTIAEIVFQVMAVMLTVVVAVATSP